MKKLKLTLEDLEVSSFAAEDELKGTGTVQGLQITGFSDCKCTWEPCFQTEYCSNYPGQPNNTCYDGCMTNQYGAC